MSSEIRKKPKAITFWWGVFGTCALALVVAALWALIDSGFFNETAHDLWYETSAAGKLAISGAALGIVSLIVAAVKQDNWDKLKARGY